MTNNVIKKRSVTHQSVVLESLKKLANMHYIMHCEFDNVNDFIDLFLKKHFPSYNWLWNEQVKQITIEL